MPAVRFEEASSPLSLQRGYWVCRCSKGGVHLLDRTLGIVRWRCTASPDGTGVPMVRRDAGTADDGKPTKTREAKVAAFHTADRRDPKTGLPERDAGSARYTAAIDSAGRRTPPQRRSCTTRRNTARPSRTCVSPRSSYGTWIQLPNSPLNSLSGLGFLQHVTH